MKIGQIDLNLMGNRDTIAAYFLPHAGGVAIVDPGPETCLPTLIGALSHHGFTPHDVTHILVTHIHLDHAGASGWFAKHGAQVCVHPAGAPHMMNPEKLIASAKRLYGDWMERLWGEMTPVPAKNLIEVQDGMDVIAGGSHIRVIHTPGHAAHHVVYIYADTIFSGDVGGTRFQPNTYLRLPFVPPETNLEQWRESLQEMLDAGCGSIAPAHFGIYSDAKAHLTQAVSFLDAVESWLEANAPSFLDVETLTTHYADFLHAHGLASGMDEVTLAQYDRGNPASFAASGLFRYWHKVRNGM